MYNIQDTRMASLAFSAFLICTFLTTVCGQTPQPVVSTSTITTGGKFSFTCDSTRVIAPTGVDSIYSLTLNRTVTGGNSVQVAQYLSVAPAGKNPEIKHLPTGRQWNFTFIGANGGAGNIGTMKIVVDVNDTQCTDAGVYYCEVVYYYTAGGNSPPISSPGQNVTASMGLSEFGLIADPVQDEYQVDDNVTFTCTAKGPSTGVTFMWEFWTDQNGEPVQQNYLPNNAQPVNNPATLQPGNTGCQLYSYVSTLSIQVPNYDSQTYKCIVSYQQQQQQQQQLSGNVTIGTTALPNEPAPYTGGDSSPDIGMIVGIVIGCIAAIVIVVGIILFLRYRKRSQENRSSGKDEHDAPNDTNLHAPPPVFYPSSKPSKGSKDEKDTKIPTGMTNEALDNSYDSRDDSKPPPRYANTEHEDKGPPRYEKEAHRGRQNRGYDEEERDRNGGHGRRQPRERGEERRHRSRDYDDDEPRRRYYTTDDGTDSRVDLGDPNMGTSI